MRLCSRLVPRSIVGVPVAFVSRISSTFFQPARSGSHLIYRKREHLAVGSLEQGLTRSRGHPPFVVALPSPFVPLLYHNLGSLSRGFFNFF